MGGCGPVYGTATNPDAQQTGDRRWYGLKDGV